MIKNILEIIFVGVNGRECFIIINLYLLYVRIVLYVKVFWDIYLLGDIIYIVYLMYLKIRKNIIFFKVNEC